MYFKEIYKNKICLEYSRNVYKGDNYFRLRVNNNNRLQVI